MHVVGVGEVLGLGVQGDIMTLTPTLTLEMKTTTNKYTLNHIGLLWA